MAFETTISHNPIMPNLKIICNLDCSLFIDGDLIQEVKANVITKIPLDIGEYCIEAVSLIHKDISLRRVVFLEYEKIFKIDLLSSLMSNQKVREELELVPKADELGLLGYVIKGSEVDLIPYQFEEAKPFSGRYAIAKQNGSWGVIDKQETIIVAFDYTSVEIDFLDIDRLIINGFRVNSKEGAGFINPSGRIIVPCKWNCCMKSGNYVLCDNSPREICLIDSNGDIAFSAKMILPLNLVRPPYLVCKDGKYGVLDGRLNEIVPINIPGYSEDDNHDSYEEDPCHSYILKDRIRNDAGEIIEVKTHCFDSYWPGEFTIHEYTYERYTPNLDVFVEAELSESIGVGVNNEIKKEEIDHHIEMIKGNGERISFGAANKIGPFYQLKAPICRNGKWALINYEGAFLCDYVYDSMPK